MSRDKLQAVEIGGVTRQAFVLRGALATGAVYGLASVGPYVGRALAQEGDDAEILNFALTLEYLEAAYYAQALKRARGLSGEAKALAREIRDNEDEHVAALAATIKDLGGKPVKAPGVDFGDAFASEEAFLALAQTFEDTGVSAYNGAAPAIQSKEVLAAAGSIVQVEARHAAAIRALNGNQPAEGAFDESLDMQAVLDAVKPYVRI